MPCESDPDEPEYHLKGQKNVKGSREVAGIEKYRLTGSD
jgi:hypothetical protein